MSETRKVAIDWQKKTATANATSGGQSYTVVMHFDNQELTIRAAIEKCIINTNIQFRAGELKAGQTYSVDPWGEVHKTTDQLIAEMSPELRAAVIAFDEAQRKAKKAA